jgi:hypothetical protein
MKPWRAGRKLSTDIGRKIGPLNRRSSRECCNALAERAKRATLMCPAAEVSAIADVVLLWRAIFFFSVSANRTFAAHQCLDRET